jgi:NADH-quinone oxidoreductase subunit F
MRPVDPRWGLVANAAGQHKGMDDHFLLPEAPVLSLDQYVEMGGVRALTRAQELGPQGTIAEVEASGLRGRGGGGFPTGRKWRGVLSQPGTDRYVVCNGAEGEPGTFKDRSLMRANPYQLVEGVVIAAFAIGAVEAFICIKASFEREYEAILRAVEELQKAGVCTDCTITIVRGPEEYLYGEEKAMLEVIEGKPPLPRLLPPFEHGLFATAPQTGWEAVELEAGHTGRHESNPTLVNNAETLSNVPHILDRGAAWFRTHGTGQSPGHVVATVVGDVVRPGVAEVELGLPLSSVIADVGGGVRLGRQVKAVFSGVANPVITAASLDAPVSYEGMVAVGSGMGSAGFIVYDDTACMVEVARQFSRFLWVESCGQCPPCKLGSEEITALLDRLEAGVGDGHDVAEIEGWLTRLTDGNRCFLAVEEQHVVGSILTAFMDEVDEHVRLGTCPRPRPLLFPKIVDLANGTAVYDDRQHLKQPDWTYAPG